MIYTSVLFDLDNTLLDFTAGEKCAVSEVLKNAGLPHDEKVVHLYSKINQTYWEKFEKGEIKKSDIFSGRFRTLFECLNVKGNAEEISKQYCAHLSLQHETIDGAFTVLDYLKLKGYKIYATTNGLSSTQYRRIEESGMKKYFGNVFVSEDAGYQKPDAEYFNFVIEHIKEKNKSKLIIIGDSQSSDILGGINSGIDTCWYNPNNSFKKYSSKYEIKSLYEIKKIL